MKFRLVAITLLFAVLGALVYVTGDSTPTTGSDSVASPSQPSSDDKALKNLSIN